LLGTKGYVVVVEKRHASYTYMHILFNNAKQSVAAWYGCDPIPLICEGGKKVVATCHPSWTICLHISILVGTLLVADSIAGSSADKQILHYLQCNRIRQINYE
jgi:hypothetical protein